MEEGKFFGVPVPPRLHVVVDQGHDRLLGLGGGDYRLNAQCGELPLVEAGLNGPIGG